MFVYKMLMFEIRAESELGVCLFRKYKPHIVGTHIYIMQTMKHTDDDAKISFADLCPKRIWPPLVSEQLVYNYSTLR